MNAWVKGHICFRKLISLVAVTAFFVSYILADAGAVITVEDAPYEMSDASLFAEIDIDTVLSLDLDHLPVDLNRDLDKAAISENVAARITDFVQNKVIDFLVALGTERR